MGSVYQALSEDESGTYAVKVLSRDQHDNQELIDAIIREGEIGKLLGKAPNIAEVIDYGYEDGEYFIISHQVEGTRLDVFISTASHLSEKQALDILIQLIDAEIHIVNCGFLYRDIKPENIIIAEDTTSVKLVDFGLCISLEQAANPEETDTLEGSPHYLPPERIVAEPEGEHSEIYSLGMLLFHMLSGTTYFSRTEIMKLMAKHVEALRMASVTTRLKYCSPKVLAILDKMIQRNPNERYRKLIPLRADLEEVYKESKGYSLSNKVKNNPKPQSVSKTEKTRKIKNIIVLSTILIVVITGIWTWSFLNKLAEKSERAEIINATATRLGIPADIKPPDLSLQEVESLISEQLMKKIEAKEREIPPFDEASEEAKICKELSISVSARKEPDLTVAALNAQIKEDIRKEANRLAKERLKTFSKKQIRQIVAEDMGIKLPVITPKKSLKSVRTIIFNKVKKKVHEEYPSKKLASDTMKILQKYKTYQIGQRIAIMDHAGMKIKGVYRGKEGNKIIVGDRKIRLQDIVPDERIKFNSEVCARKAANGIKRLKEEFKTKRIEYEKACLKKIEKKYYNQYGYAQDKGEWKPAAEVIDAKVELAKKKLDKKQALKKKKIWQRINDNFDREKYFREYGYRKIEGKWYSEEDAVNILLKKRRNSFNTKRNKKLSKLKKELRKKLEKEIFESHRFIYYDNKWQPAASVLQTESQKIYMQTK